MRPTLSSMMHKPQHNTNYLNSQNLIANNSMTTNAWVLYATALSLVFFNKDKHCLTPAKLLNLLQSVLMENSTKNISFKEWININSDDWSTMAKSTSSPMKLHKEGFVPHTEPWLFLFFQEHVQTHHDELFYDMVSSTQYASFTDKWKDYGVWVE